MGGKFVFPVWIGLHLVTRGAEFQRIGIGGKSIEDAPETDPDQKTGNHYRPKTVTFCRYANPVPQSPEYFHKRFSSKNDGLIVSRAMLMIINGFSRIRIEQAMQMHDDILYVSFIDARL